MSPLNTLLAVLALVLILWIAYKIGKILLRILAGLLFLGLLGYGVWYFFLR